MNERNCKAVVTPHGQSVIVLGKDGKEWRLSPGAFCKWTASDPTRQEIVGLGETIWEAIWDAEREWARL